MADESPMATTRRTKVLAVATAFSVLFAVFGLTVALWPQPEGYELHQTIPD